MANMFAGECQRIYDQLESDPTFDDGDRQQVLVGQAGKGSFEGVDYVRWQIDVTSGARVWYFIDERPEGKGQKRRSGRVIIDQVHFAHPKSTERKPGNKVRPGRK
jgi:hypothetical protein